jgi:O-acetyl-ADP-ribose deacetylase (regulator of RNase III)
MELHYLIGDATDPIVKPTIIAHICNDCQPVGAWGSGFVIELSKKNKTPQEAYLKWSKEGSSGGYELGAIQIVPFTKDVWVANMIAQHDIRLKNNIPPIRYEALEQCLASVYKHAKNNRLTVAGPRFGADRSGGDWPTIEAIIKKTMTVDTYIYTLESQKDHWPTQYENADDLIKSIGLQTCVPIIRQMAKDGLCDPIPGDGTVAEQDNEDLSSYFK